MKLTIGRLLFVLILAGVIGAVMLALQPQPVPVDFAIVARGPLQVTVHEDGKTRVRERYVVSAPLSGKLQRIDLRPGDSVQAGATILATIDPIDPALLDSRDRAIAEARVKAAELAVQQAHARQRQLEADAQLAAVELERVRRLDETGAGTRRELDIAVATAQARTEAVATAEFGGRIAKFELEQAQAALLHATSEVPTPQTVRCQILSPIQGRILRVFQESSAVVTAGTPLIELGDPADLEVEVDLLSTDAVQILPGAAALIEHWGGTQSLKGHVKMVEPAGFTKISALGVEEQRVNVIIRLDAPVEQRGTLGDAYRVEVRIIVWEQAEVLQVPTSCLFRNGDDWSVYTVQDEVAVSTPVEIGHRSETAAEVLSGLKAGDRVIEHPADNIKSGVPVISRPE